MIDTGETPGGVRLRPPQHRVDRRAVLWWGCRAGAVVVVLLAALAPAAWWFASAREFLLVGMLLVGAFGTGYAVVMPWWRYRVHRWETTDSAVYTASGWLSREWRVAPMSRIQTVDTARGPLQRMFGLSTVTVTTASAAGPLSIAGLDHEVASDLAERLTMTTQAVPGDAT
ncbi:MULTISPECIES: PH domain-containing protein [unclassified Actinopolyspora]|uniref:PH domain-containing protein n=1 Tax=unclassified Actinopolyspora TaxID=2639451 RepID=UPI0013F59FFA|nr:MULTISPECIES: PH domain-containing protein [unclassified Actinopolyspora]NHD18083.1 PH domain-containing protein [Actinopolyspora sp. BKK2]NHE78594.1 PH domain-containing protein [Actinopolyspora sp. BKK1]